MEEQQQPSVWTIIAQIIFMVFIYILIGFAVAVGWKGGEALFGRFSKKESPEAVTAAANVMKAAEEQGNDKKADTSKQ